MIRGHFRHPWRAPGHGRDDPIPHAGAEATSVRGGGVGAGWPPSEPGRADGGCARRNASSWVRLNGAGGLREASHGQATAWPVADSRAGQRSGVSARDVGGAAVVLERRADPDGDQARHREGGRRCQPAPAIRCSPPVRRAGPAAQGASSPGACRRGGHRLRRAPAAAESVGQLPRVRGRIQGCPAAGPTRRPVRSPSSPPSSLPGVSGSWPPTGTAGTSRRSPARPPSRSASDRTGARRTTTTGCPGSGFRRGRA